MRLFWVYFVFFLHLRSFFSFAAILRAKIQSEKEVPRLHDLRKILRGAALIGVGATLLVMEKGDEWARRLAARGKAAMAQRSDGEEPIPDVSRLNQRQRDALRRRLDEADGPNG